VFVCVCSVYYYIPSVLLHKREREREKVPGDDDARSVVGSGGKTLLMIEERKSRLLAWHYY
jgi:hypothetical protein